MMRSIGFCTDWISLIMTCITSVKYSVVLNGRVGREFRPQRGLRQGDPLSPYLFLICAEGFSRLLDLAKREGKLLGARVGRSNISVSHLFFVDDSVIFGKATREGDINMGDVIREYEGISGQLVNFEKSLIYFSGNTDKGTRAQVGGIFGVRFSNNPEKYLGLPVGRRKKHAFVVLKDWCIKLINNWSSRIKGDFHPFKFTSISTSPLLPIHLVTCIDTSLSVMLLTARNDP
ncbi:hypothetical protein J1N35_005764 [Gossypium stocksii]|uniref:Reverse transcriptase domain-containing protein n=1 Tax=Gossypium stocksii TaxID=47602 RepID=A0A9D3WEH5_9ROSI|nr:hypothetical protein J1N35_005764 [Gossypium stocksii]